MEERGRVPVRGEERPERVLLLDEQAAAWDRALDFGGLREEGSGVRAGGEGFEPSEKGNRPSDSQGQQQKEACIDVLLCEADPAVDLVAAAVAHALEDEVTDDLAGATRLRQHGVGLARIEVGVSRRADHLEVKREVSHRIRRKNQVCWHSP
jgi:hypothetical protein